jgi:serine/threonine-protein kinase
MADDREPPTRARTDLPTNPVRNATQDTLITATLGAPLDLPAQGYQLGDLIGRGGMGEVIAAHDTRIGREVAIKRTRKAAPDDETTVRFLREARIQARLDHPAIVPVYELGTDDAGRPYFAMKRVSGKTLEERLNEGAPVQVLLRALIDVCLAMDLAHSRGVVHRDLKPANIMMGDYGEVYVLDWGIARVLGEPHIAGTAGILPPSDATATGALLGTPGYMSPEQIAGVDEVRTPADIYALGSILFEILVREPLHPRGSQSAIGSTITNPQESPARRRPEHQIAPELDTVCLEALAEDPDARPTARGLADRIQRYLDGDRDLEQRKKLAVEQLAVARDAMSSTASDARATTMRRAGRALALDPESVEAAELVSALMLEPPDKLPDDLVAALGVEQRAATTERARRAAIAYLSVFAMWVIIPFLDIRNLPLLLGFYAMIALTAAWSWLRSRSGREGFQVALVLNMLLAVLFSRVAGPFMLTSVFVCAVIGALSLTSWAHRRPVILFAWIAVTVMGPLVLEWTGVIGKTWGITASGIWTDSVMFGLHGWREELALVMANLVFISILAIFAWNVGVSRSRAMRAVRIQAWHLAQLLPASRRPHSIA